MNILRRITSRRRSKSRKESESSKRVPFELIPGRAAMILHKGNHALYGSGGAICRITLARDLIVDLMKISCADFCEFVLTGAFEKGNEVLSAAGVDPWRPEKPISVIYEEASSYAAWKGKRLLKSEEWEAFACYFNQERHQIEQFVRQFLFIGQGVCEFHPLFNPAEWCMDHIAKGKIHLGAATPDAFIKVGNEEERRFSFRCCEEAE